MARLIIASDIHGDAETCARLVDIYRESGAERLVLLGDLLYHGPRNDLPAGYAPKKVIELLNSLKNDILAVRGNCDTEVDQMVLQFPILADYAYISVDGLRIFATHGHNFNTTKLPPLAKGDILLHGHTHLTVCEEGDGYVYMNPGSLALPKEGTHHGYMTYEAGVFTWKTLDGDVWKEYSV